MKASIFCCILLFFMCFSSYSEVVLLHGFTHTRDTLSPSNDTYTSEIIPDASFMKEVAAAMQQEIDLAQLAMKKSVNHEIKYIAQMVTQDYAKALADLKELTHAVDNNFIGSRSAEDSERIDNTIISAEYNLLDQKSGGDFDRSWYERLLERQQRSTSQYKSQFNRSKNLQLKKWILVRVPYFTKHQQALMECKTIAKL